MNDEGGDQSLFEHPPISEFALMRRRFNVRRRLNLPFEILTLRRDLASFIE